MSVVQASRVDPAPAPEAARPLPRALALFRAFEAAGVRHCHYKSNEHLLAGLAGLTDLDVLVDRRHARRAQDALRDAGFKRFAARGASAHAAVEDHLGFDEASGRLLHAHVYYALVVGGKHLKDHQLALAEPLLDTAVEDPATGVRTAEPSHEMLLLLVRYALKARWRDRLLEPLGRPCFDADARREHAWLHARLDPEAVRSIAEREYGEHAAALIDAMVDRPPSVGRLRALRRRLAPALASQRSFGALESIPLRLVREAAWWLSGINRRLVHLPIPLHRTHPAGGRTIALLGADGSGKSTVARDLAAWLAWKLDVHVAYFGSGDGPSSLLRWPLKAAVRLRGRHRAAAGSAPGAQAPRAAQRVSAARALWAVLLAREKRAKMRACTRARQRGMLVVCDRYPQARFPGFNDGPMLAPWLGHRSRWRRALARWECELYRALEREAPDLVIKLDATPEAALARSPDSSPDEVVAKREAVRALDYGPRSRSVALDAMRPLEEVRLAARRAVWEQL